MRTGTVVRQGRTRHVSQGERGCNKGCAQNCLIPSLAVFAFVGISVQLFRSETYYHQQQVAFNEVEDQVRHLPSTSRADTQYQSDDSIVHFVAEYTSTVSDDDFAVDLDHALKLQRSTEYCQWREHEETTCQTCTRTDNEGNDEDYECDCEKTYYYVKAWRPTRVNSFLFDQPANHHNPQRDPYPSLSRFSSDTASGALTVSSSIVANLRAPTRPLVFTHNANPIPRSWFLRTFIDPIFGAPPAPRYETVREGLGHFLDSPAARGHNFMYTNHADGWFFSHYEASNFERAIKGFGQYLEGSLLDWQLGDVYDFFNGCTAGDIRSRFMVADPHSISVIGAFQNGGAIRPYVAHANGFEIGLLHAGQHGAEAMFSNETSEAHWTCKIYRALSVIAGLAFTYLAKRVAPRGSSLAIMTTTPKAFMLVALASGLLLVAAVWVLAYGLSDWGGTDSDLYTIVAAAVGVGLLAVANQQGKIQGKML